MIYLPILLLWFAVPAEMQTGTYFIKRTESYASYNSWILTFTVDIEPYARELRNIAHELDGFKLVYQDFQNRPVHVQCFLVLLRMNWTVLN